MEDVYSLDARLFAEAIKNTDNEYISHEILKFIDFFSHRSIDTSCEGELITIQHAANLIFHALANPDYFIPERLIPKFVTSATLFSNLAYLTEFGTTDSFLSMIANQRHNLPKILTLYTPRNTTDIPLEKLFKASPVMTTLWWAMLTNQFRGITKESSQKYHKLLTSKEAWDGYDITNNNYEKFDWLTHPAFDISYTAPDMEKPLRQLTNEQLKAIRIYRTKPPSRNYKNVLVISYAFRKGMAIHKAIAEYFHALKPEYRLTYLNLQHAADPFVMDDDLFDEIIHAFDETGLSEKAFKALQEGDYGVIIYPDTSLCFNSSALAQSRLAPIQITTYGHPVSTWSDEMDYFIGGQDTEADFTYGNYSERLVLLPGNGNCPLPVTDIADEPELDEYRICCSWGYIKTHYAMLDLLNRIRERSDKPIKFFFTDINTNRLTFLAAKKEIESVMGDGAIVSRSLPRPLYMKNIAQCKFAIDSWPFGGFNRILDLLAQKRPVIIREGNRAYNRMNAALLERIGLEELVVQTEKQVISKSLELIFNEDYRLSLIERIGKADIYNKGDAKYFKKALDFLITNHDALHIFKNNKPIIIKRD